MDGHEPLANLGVGNLSRSRVHQQSSSSDRRLLERPQDPCQSDVECEFVHGPSCGHHDQCNIVYRLGDALCHGDSNHCHQSRIHFSAMATFSL